MSNSTNNLRTLASVISVDGWIAEFDDASLATVHVDLVFREAAFGENSEDKVSFRIKLKRAELILRIPNGEPLSVRRETIARTVESTITEVVTTTASAAAIEGSVAVSAGNGCEVPLSAKASGEASGSVSRQTLSETRQSLTNFDIQHFTRESAVGWEITSRSAEPLKGSPWDATASPRFKVKRSSPRNAEGNKPTIKLEVRCRREDIEILELKAKDPAIMKRLMQRAHRDRHLVVAEQMIKDQIAKEGFLALPDMNNPVSIIVVADMLVMEQE